MLRRLGEMVCTAAVGALGLRWMARNIVQMANAGCGAPGCTADMMCKDCLWFWDRGGPRERTN